MPKKQDKKSTDAQTITLLFIVGFIALQIINLLQLSINETLTLSTFQDKATTQLLPFFIGYFIALLYVGKRHS